MIGGLMNENVEQKQENGYQIGDRFEVNDTRTTWAHNEVGVILATYPPNTESPHAYEALIAGRPLIITSRNMRKVVEE